MHSNSSAALLQTIMPKRKGGEGERVKERGLRERGRRERERQRDREAEKEQRGKMLALHVVRGSSISRILYCPLSRAMSDSRCGPKTNTKNFT